VRAKVARDSIHYLINDLNDFKSLFSFFAAS